MQSAFSVMHKTQKRLHLTSPESVTPHWTVWSACSRRQSSQMPAQEDVREAEEPQSLPGAL